MVECAVKPDVYDVVLANGDKLDGTPTGNEGREDFPTSDDTLLNRANVDFVNQVNEGAMRTLKITTKVFDVDGRTPLHYPEDETLFNFRLYLGSENENGDELPPANMYAYCVKDADDYYCK